MAEKQDFTRNALFIGGFNLLIVLLALAIFSSDDSPASKPLTAVLASGEWAPYSGEQLPENGVATAIVSEVLQNMGYQAQFNFMSWPQAEQATVLAESNNEIRATFPYSEVGNRNQDFYFSVPILDVDYVLLFNPAVVSQEQMQRALAKTADTFDHWQADMASLPSVTIKGLNQQRDKLNLQQDLEIEAAADNSAQISRIKIEYQQKFSDLVRLAITLNALDVRIINMSGYKFPDFLSPYIDADSEQVLDNLRAVELLKSSGRRLVLLEANRVAESLLRSQFIDDYLAVYSTLTEPAASKPPPGTLRRAPLRYLFGVHLMAGKKNPENYHFIREFDRQFITLKKNGRIEAIISSIERAIQAQRTVRLQPFNGEGFLRAYSQPSVDSDFIILANGTHAIVQEWSPSYLRTHSPGQPVVTGLQPGVILPGLVKVRIQKGPHENSTVYIDGRSIHIL